MNRSIYTKLAISNLKNNRKSYIPYVLTAILTVMMYYMMANLAANSPMNQEALQIILSLSVHVIEIFALIFLFYTNSFLIKRRKREIGVYHILGMGKPQLAKMLVIETVVTGAVSILGGIFFGTALAKLMYALLKRMIHYDDKLAFRMSWEIAGNTVLFFTLIFALTLIYNLLQIRLANPIELLHAGSQGEREPKTKWLLTVAGIIFLGIGYYIAITTKEPLKALQLFFVAVICVIIGTYALFTAGSIAFLKLLRKNKNFYYKTKHFISVSGMLYRMKQNAVGLSNICVLSTMVLVTISSTVSLYIGKEDVLRTRYPQEVYITNSVSDDAENQKLHDMAEKICRENNVEITDEKSWHMAELVKIKNGEEYTSAMIKDNSSSDLVFFDVIRLADYNQLTGERMELGDKEAILFTNGENYGKDTIRIDEETWMVKKELDTAPFGKKSDSNTENVYYMIVSDEKEFMEAIEKKAIKSGASKAYIMDIKKEFMEDYLKKYQLETEDKPVKWIESFNLRGREEQKLKAVKELKAQAESEFENTGVQGRYLEKETFFGLYGGVFFIGMYLGSLFLMATVLIIYYKQISEGFDDRERYQIMQKVGMSKREVKSSIRSQILMVFFLPLVMAIIHIAVAFPVITKLLSVFYLKNTKLFFGCTAGTVGIFAVFYVIVFVITAKEYYKIVE